MLSFLKEKFRDPRNVFKYEEILLVANDRNYNVIAP
jgi:hypothetical protein